MPTVFGFQSLRLNSAGTTTIKSGAGVLQSIIVGGLGTILSTVTAYDNTSGSGTIITSLNSVLISGQLEYRIKYVNGLTIVIVGVPDITVVYA